jgi:large subunit ribosomal protein L10
MSSQSILDGKKATVAEITDKMKNSASFVVVDYQGITVAQANALRNAARAAGVDYRIYKNTFCRFAAKSCGFEGLEEVLEGPNAIAFSSDAVAPAKVIADFVKENRLQILRFKGGVIDGKVADADSVQKISQLPGRDALLAQMVGSFNAPIAKLAYAVNAIKEKLETA